MTEIQNKTELIKSALLGVAIGDALGVPYEFKSRDRMLEEPATGMTGHGTHNMPAGTFSDDSSLTFCLAEMLTGEFDLQILANHFVKWLHEGYWTATGKTFDVGMTTREAINRFMNGVKPELAGGTDEHSNGNGSLMRVLPLVFHMIDKPVEERFRLVSLVSSVTHAHIRSVVACFYYLEFARLLILKTPGIYAYIDLQRDLPPFLNRMGVEKTEIEQFNRLFHGDIRLIPEKKYIYSDGYVVHTLEASVYCFIKTLNYKDAVLKAVNLGEDTDTTAAVTGGLAGLVYGYHNIPVDWMEKLARRADIEDLAVRMAANTSGIK